MTKKGAAKAAAAGSFEFGNDGTSDLKALAQKLLKHGQSKDALLKALKPMSQALEDCPQDVATALGDAAPVVSKALLQYVGHADKDIKLYVAECMAKMLRIYAPDSPCTDAELHGVFELLIWALARLDKPDGALYPRLITILTLMDQVKFYLLLLDLTPATLIPKLWGTLLNCVREQNIAEVEDHILAILEGLLTEAGEDIHLVASDEVLDLTLLALVGRGAADAQTPRLARHLICRCANVLQSALQKRLVSLLDSVGQGKQQQLKQPARKKRRKAAEQDDDGEDGEEEDEERKAEKEDEGGPAAVGLLKDADVYQAILKLYCCVPQVMLPVLPRLARELASPDSEARRRGAADLVLQLYCVPDSDLAVQDVHLLHAFRERFRDPSTHLRLLMLEHVGTLVAAGVPFASQLLEEAEGRLADPAETVRSAACRVLCTLSAADLTSVPPASLEAVGKRLRDAKPAVAIAAAEGLVEVFRAWCNRVAKHGFSDSLDQLAAWIPGRMLWALLRSPEPRNATFALLGRLPGGLLPAGLKDTLCADIWALVYESAHPLEREAFVTHVAQRANVQLYLAEYVALERLARRAGVDDEQREAARARASKRLTAAVAQCTRGGTAERARAVEAAAQKLSAVKDGKVFDRLAVLGDPATHEGLSREARKDLLERLGSKTPLSEAMATLLNAAQPLVLQPQHLAALLEAALGQLPQVASGAAGTGPGGVSAAASLVSELARRAAPLLSPLVPRAAALLVASHRRQQEQQQQQGRGRSSKQQKKGGGGRAALDLLDSQDDADLGGPCEPLGGQGVVLATLLLAKATGLYLRPQGSGSPPRQPLPTDALTAALRHVCEAGRGPLRAARWAPSALQALLLGGKGAGAVGAGNGSSNGDAAAAAEQLLRDVAQTAAERLLPSEAATTGTPSAIQALCGVGRACPAAFADQADVLVTYVTDSYLEAQVQDMQDEDEDGYGGGGDEDADARAEELRPRALAVGGSGMEPAVDAVKLSRGVLLKGLALKAVARALSPDAAAPGASRLPALVKDAAKTYMQTLEQLVDLDTDLSRYSADGDAEQGHLRLCAAKALLRLSTHHRLPVRTWTLLALMVQDPVAAARSGFASKLAAAVVRLNSRSASSSSSGLQGGGGNGGNNGSGVNAESVLAMEAAQYVAMLPLAGRALRDHVKVRRELATASARRKGSGSGDGGAHAASAASLHATLHPEFLLPYLMYLLGHHPDMPEPSSAGAEDGGGTLPSFARMLQLALEPMLVPPQAVGHGKGKAASDEVGASLPLVLKLLQKIKCVEDQDQEIPATDKVRALCDMAAALARLVVEHAGGAPPEDQPTASDYPGSLLLPITLYTKGDSTLHEEGSHLPEGYSPALDLSVWGAGIRRLIPPGLTVEEHPDEEAAGHEPSPGKKGSRAASKKGVSKKEKGAAGAKGKVSGGKQKGKAAVEQEPGSEDGQTKEEDASDKEEEGGGKGGEEEEGQKVGGKGAKGKGKAGAGKENGSAEGQGQGKKRKQTGEGAKAGKRKAEESGATAVPGAAKKGKGGGGSAAAPAKKKVEKKIEKRQPEAPTRRQPARATRPTKAMKEADDSGDDGDDDFVPA